MIKNSRFAIATHILALLALNGEKPLSSKSIACSVNTNPVFIRRILGTLSKAGLVKTLMGMEGGSVLNRPADEVTLFEVYKIIEPTGHLFGLHHSPPNPECPCGRAIQPVLQDRFKQAEFAVACVLQKITIADIQQDITTVLADLELA